MIKIISSFLIVALSLQAVGCYSAQELKVSDLRNIGDKRVIKLVTNDLQFPNDTEFMLQNPPQSNNCFGWSLDEENIYIYYKYEIRTQITRSQTSTKIIKIPFSSIKYLSTDVYDSGRTLLCIVGIAAVILAVLAGIAAAGLAEVFSNIGK